MAWNSAASPLDRLPDGWPDRDFSSFHTVGAVRWHVQQQGQGPTVLLLHGTGGSTHSWAACTASLARRYRVVAIDLPGHGFTHAIDRDARTRQPFALSTMASAIAALLRRLGLLPQFAVGHSAGMPVLMQLALQGDIAPQHLLGVCPALVAPPAWYVRLVAPVLATVVESDAVAASGAWIAQRTPLIRLMLESAGSPLTALQFARYEWLCRQPDHVQAALSMMSRWDLPALMREAATLRTPLTLLAGRADRWVPLPALRRAAARLPAATLVDVPGGHLLPEEHPDEVLARIEGP
jgi:magnesium chelatase accessory protein